MLASGVLHWECGDFSAYRVNPPLTKLVAAMPALLRECKTQAAADMPDLSGRWEFRLGERFKQENDSDFVTMLVLGRVACLIFSAIAGWYIWKWASSLYNHASGVSAVLLWSVEPNLMAHSELITSDSACVAFGLMASFHFWQWLQDSSRANTVLAGVSLGLALASKFTWVGLLILWPVIAGVVFLWMRPKQRDAHMGSHYVATSQLALICIIGIITVNSMYLFGGSFSSLGSYSLRSSSLSRLQRVMSHTGACEWLPVPFPEHYVYGLDDQMADCENYPIPAYLRGQWRPRGNGWWWYYIYGAAVKIPASVWLLLLISLVFFWSAKSPRIVTEGHFVIASVALFVLIVVSIHTAINQHLRYALPSLVFVLLPAARQYVGTSRRECIHVLLSAALISCTALTTWSVPTDCLSYFNVFSGGPADGYRHLLGSNLDWGQNEWHVQDWLRENEAWMNCGGRERAVLSVNNYTHLQYHGRPMRVLCWVGWTHCCVEFVDE